MAYKIFINAGHCPNKDNGACYNDLRECDINKEVSEALCEELKRRGYEIMFMQDDSLERICDNANKFQANLFVSIHCNAHDSNASGTEVYWYPNSAAEKCGVAVRKNICKILQTQERFNNDGGWLYVLKHTAMPAILVELFFISSVTDVAKYMAHKDELPNAIADGIEEHFN